MGLLAAGAVVAVSGVPVLGLVLAAGGISLFFSSVWLTIRIYALRQRAKASVRALTPQERLYVFAYMQESIRDGTLQYGGEVMGLVAETALKAMMEERRAVVPSAPAAGSGSEPSPPALSQQGRQ